MSKYVVDCVPFVRQDGLELDLNEGNGNGFAGFVEYRHSSASPTDLYLWTADDSTNEAMGRLNQSNPALAAHLPYGPIVGPASIVSLAPLFPLTIATLEASGATSSGISALHAFDNASATDPVGGTTVRIDLSLDAIPGYTPSSGATDMTLFGFLFLPLVSVPAVDDDNNPTGGTWSSENVGTEPGDTESLGEGLPSDYVGAFRFDVSTLPMTMTIYGLYPTFFAEGAGETFLDSQDMHFAIYNPVLDDIAREAVPDNTGDIAAYLWTPNTSSGSPRPITTRLDSSASAPFLIKRAKMTYYNFASTTVTGPHFSGPYSPTRKVTGSHKSSDVHFIRPKKR